MVIQPARVDTAGNSRQSLLERTHKNIHWEENGRTMQGAALEAVSRGGSLQVASVVVLRLQTSRLRCCAPRGQAVVRCQWCLPEASAVLSRVQSI